MLVLILVLILALNLSLVLVLCLSCDGLLGSLLLVFGIGFDIGIDFGIGATICIGKLGMSLVVAVLFFGLVLILGIIYVYVLI